jgi:hypothetical protein
MRQLIYPDKRLIANEEIVSWAMDRRVTDVMNGRNLTAAWVSVETSRSRRGLSTVVHFAVKEPTLEEAVAELSDAGVATFAAQAAT